MIMQPILLTWEDYHDNALMQKKKKNNNMQHMQYENTYFSIQ